MANGTTDANVPSSAKWIVSGVAVALALAHVLFPQRVVLDTPTLGLLAAAALPWLGHLFSSVELPGGWKLQFQELQRQVAIAQGAAESAQRKTEVALQAGAPVTPLDPGEAILETALTGEDGALAELDALAEEYQRIRRTQHAGPARTAAMSDVVRRLLAIAPRAQRFPLAARLTDAASGNRLSAYARLYACPTRDALAPLVQTLTTLENEPFGQYWAILALQRVLRATPSDGIPRSETKALHDLLGELRPGTDRHYELSRALEMLA